MSDWWTRKMGGPSAPAPAQQQQPWVPPEHQYRTTQPPAMQPRAPQPQEEEGEPSLTVMLRKGDPNSTKTMHEGANGCPRCGGDYLEFVGPNKARGTCANCGYPTTQGPGPGIPVTGTSKSRQPETPPPRLTP